ncbi:MAG: dihydrofolate reductase [Candidatus Saccharimonadales bacterium]
MAPEKTIVVAYDRNRTIGYKGSMPWHGQLPADLRHFKELTFGHAVVMGRHTYESIGRPLPNRHNIVLTKQRDLQLLGCTVVNSLESAYESAADEGGIYVIGGSRVYSIAMPTVDRLVVTEIEADFPGDTYFPEIPPEWQEVSRSQTYEVDENNRYPYTFVEYERI